MLTNKNFKFLFYNFNDRQMRPLKRPRHTIISEDEHDLLELQREDWPYFIEKVLEKMSEKKNLDLKMNKTTR